MNRRQFLRSIGAAAVAAQIPAALLAEPAKASGTEVVADWVFDYDTKTIYCINVDAKGCTLWELYMYLKSEWGNDTETTYSITPEPLITLNGE